MTNKSFVTVAEYVAGGGTDALDLDTQRDYPNWPVLGVSWNDADSWCKRNGGRLPTYAELKKEYTPFQEWTADDAGALKVVRGGSWLNLTRLVRASDRVRYEPAIQNFNLGFRCIQEL